VNKRGFFEETLRRNCSILNFSSYFKSIKGAKLYLSDNPVFYLSRFSEDKVKTKKDLYFYDQHGYPPA
jgi:hypothetical protein